MHFSHVILAAISAASSATAGVLQERQTASCPAMPINQLYILAAYNYVFTIQCGIDYSGNDIGIPIPVSSGPWACADLCGAYNGVNPQLPPCRGAVFNSVDKACQLKSDVSKPVNNDKITAVSGKGKYNPA